MDEQTNLTQLPMLALAEIPTPTADAQQIVALVKTGGRVSGYKLADGSVLDKQAAVELARQGGIQDVGIASRNGNYYLKSLPDAVSGNNLGDLPSISM